MPRIGHAGSFMLVTFRRENFPFFLKRNHHRIALKSISFCFWSGQTKIVQPKIKSLNHLPSKIMCRIPRMDFPSTPRHGIPQHETPVFSLFHSFNASQDPERIGKKHGTIGISSLLVRSNFCRSIWNWPVPHKKIPTPTPTFWKSEIKKNSNFSQDHHRSWSMKF